MNQPTIAIVGAGIGGLSLALHLHKRGLRCELFEAAHEVKELGVGITLLPHAMREIADLGLQSEIEAAGIENYESVFATKHGQFIHSELRGRHAGYPVPEIGIHRGRLHRTLFLTAVQRLGADCIHLGKRFTGLSQAEGHVHMRFADGSTHTVDVLVAADGINSGVRKTFYPAEELAFAGINTWRGVTRMKPILGGKTYLRVGAIETGKLVIYPIINYEDGTQLVNWMAEIKREGSKINDWNKSGKLEDFFHIYQDWRFDWLDVPKMLREAQFTLEYPMVDKDLVDRWTFDRVTLMGDAAHPMYPRGSNGSAQAMIDARTLADELLVQAQKPHPDWPAALQGYEAKRRDACGKIVLTNRSTPPDLINTLVEERTGGKPFDDIDAVISKEELVSISAQYKAVAGFGK